MSPSNKRKGQKKDVPSIVDFKLGKTEEELAKERGSGRKKRRRRRDSDNPDMINGQQRLLTPDLLLKIKNVL